jgi:RNA polymerase sigma factor (sigma-70 family)
MNMHETHGLLREFRQSQSEEAFAKLVARYIDLVYSVAMRRVAGNVHLARDIVQTVFTDLACKAPFLPDDIMLGGWLHRHTSFVASSVCRGESRRKAREREAMDIFATGDSEVQDFPVELDEAIEDLEEVDRTAILLRFFEQASFRTIGAALGISDDTAQKRVARALEKLRTLLQARGITLSLTGLSSILALKSVSAAPFDWASEVSAEALLTAPAKWGALATGMAFFAWHGSKVAIPLLLALAVVCAFVSSGYLRPKPVKSGVERRSGATRLVAPGTTVKPAQPRMAGDPEGSGVVGLPSSNRLRLTIVAADTGKPIPNVVVDSDARQKDVFWKKALYANRFGICDLTLPSTLLTGLRLGFRLDGFADTTIQWHPDRGEVIPSVYTLRLPRAVPISGRVLNDQNQPVFGAKVVFNHQEDPIGATSLESHKFDTIEVLTDPEGRWRVNRIGDETLPRIYGCAHHDDYSESSVAFVDKDLETLQQLKAGTHVFHLANALVVRGSVLDAQMNPVSNASVLIGHQDEADARQGYTDRDGTFEISGCTPGRSLATAKSRMLAPSTVAIEVATNMNPVRIVLHPGKVLRLRVVNRVGEGIPSAQLWLNTHDPTAASDRYGSNEAPLTQTDFKPVTDSEGMVFWERAPDRELAFDIEAAGYMRIYGTKVRPDGEEHRVTLAPALKIMGTVQDEQTSKPIPRFRIITGSLGEARSAPFWSSIERYWMEFSDGRFERNLEQPISFGRARNDYIFKIEAEGYAPFVTRVVRAEEECARFDLKLKPALRTTITVLLPNGKPAPHTEVLFAGPSETVEIGPVGFERHGGTVPLTTDEQGRVYWQHGDPITSIIAVNSEGFCETIPASLNEQAMIQLQSWGSVEGTMSTRGRGESELMLGVDRPSKGGNAVGLHWNARITTDAAGKFKFPQAPPGRFSLVYFSSNVSDPLSLSAVPLQEIVIRAGETTVINRDNGAVKVSVHLVWPANVPREATQKVYAFISGENGSWVLRESSGNIWKNSNVRSGTNRLRVVVATPRHDGQSAREILRAEKTMLVDPDSNDGELDIVEFYLEKPPANAAPW